MKFVKYVVERQMIYSIDERSLIDTIAEYDDFIDALEELDKVVQSYANDKNVVIEINEYEFDENNQEYEYIETIIKVKVR